MLEQPKAETSDKIFVPTQKFGEDFLLAAQRLSKEL